MYRAGQSLNKSALPPHGPASFLTVKLSLKDEPGGTSHCVTPTGPSMSVVPFWNIPWKCMLVDSLPSYIMLMMA